VHGVGRSGSSSRTAPSATVGGAPSDGLPASFSSSSSPSRHRRQDWGGNLQQASVRARRCGRAYIGEVGRVDGGSRLGTRGAHPRRQTWLHDNVLSTAARHVESGGIERGKGRRKVGWRGG
jgi:hypothetical protein